LTQSSLRDKYQQSILTAHACKAPPDLEAALSIVAQLLLSDRSKAEMGIQHLCFLQDVELLYRTALGMYNLDLTLLVAQHSQKDPKEYLPFLRNLQQQEQWRMRFLIDDYLKRYTKALGSLDKLGQPAFAELEDYVCRHSLFQNALSLFKYVPEKQNQILILYAENLREQHSYREAGLTYESLGQFSRALECYLLGLDWKEAVALIQQERDQVDDEFSLAIKDKGAIFSKLAGDLLEARHYREAATIFLEYVRDVPEAVASYCKGNYYDDAIRVCGQHKMPELLISVVDPGLGEGFGHFSELLSDCKNQITSQVRRLRELRVTKEADPMGFFGEPEESDAPDNISLASTESSTAPSYITQYTGKTGGTAKTGASRRTAKNRRREERKRARGKKGTIYEEEYLINSIGRLIERVDDSELEVTRLIEGLIRRNMRTHSFQLQKLFVQVRESLKSVVNEVFTLSDKDRERYDDEGNVYYLPEIPVPEIKEFKRFATLDYDLE
jgi:elongator complex protein 1